MQHARAGTEDDIDSGSDPPAGDRANASMMAGLLASLTGPTRHRVLRILASEPTRHVAAPQPGAGDSGAVTALAGVLRGHGATTALDEEGHPLPPRLDSEAAGRALPDDLGAAALLSALALGQALPGRHSAHVELLHAAQFADRAQGDAEPDGHDGADNVDGEADALVLAGRLDFDRDALLWLQRLLRQRMGEA